MIGRMTTWLSTTQGLSLVACMPRTAVCAVMGSQPRSAWRSKTVPPHLPGSKTQEGVYETDLRGVEDRGTEQRAKHATVRAGFEEVIKIRVSSTPVSPSNTNTTTQSARRQMRGKVKRRGMSGLTW